MKPDACLHCGEPAQKTRGEPAQATSEEPAVGSEFCCMGCRTAYHLIRSAGLGAVYEKGEHHWKPPSESKLAFEIFDHPDFLDRRAPMIEGCRSGEFVIEGLMCAACIWVVEHLPHFHSFIQESRVDFGRSILKIRWRDQPQALSKIASTLSKLGYRLRTDELHLSRSKIPKIEWIRLGISGASVAGAMHIGFLLVGSQGTNIDAESARNLGLLAGLAALPAITFGAFPFFRTSFQALKMRRISSDILVALSVLLGGFVSLVNALKGSSESYFDSLAMIIFLLLLGRIILRLASSEIYQKPEWFARRSGQWVPASSLKIGDEIECLSEEIVPIDCRLCGIPDGVAKQIWFDLSATNGESLPHQVLEGQLVLQGSIPLSDCRLRVESSLENSYLERIQNKVNLLSAGPGVGTSIFANAGVLESIFSLSIILIALCFLFLTKQDSISQAIAVLIVTCPCAIQLSRPLAMLAFQRESLRKGIRLFRIERIFGFQNAGQISFDKTGTLTKGKPVLVHEAMLSKSEFSQSVINSVVFTLSARSQHPLSHALAFAFSDRHRESVELTDFKETPGEGISARWANKLVELKKNTNSQRMQTSLYIEGRELLKFELQDQIRDECQEVMAELKTQGFKILVLSGDKKAEVEAFKRSLSNVSGRAIIEAKGDLSPTEKASFQNQNSIFVGDGLNDAEAMRASGLAIGFSGSAEANIKAADVYLIRRDLQLIPTFLSALLRARQNIRINFGVSFIYNAVSIYLVYRGFLGPILCAIFMPLSSLSVMGFSFLRASYSGRNLEVMKS